MSSSFLLTPIITPNILVFLSIFNSMSHLFGGNIYIQVPFWPTIVLKKYLLRYHSCKKRIWCHNLSPFDLSDPITSYLSYISGMLICLTDQPRKLLLSLTSLNSILLENLRWITRLFVPLPLPALHFLQFCFYQIHFPRRFIKDKHIFTFTLEVDPGFDTL